MSKVSDVPDLCPEKVGGTFDVVLFLGVFYHLLDLIDGLRRASSLANEVLVVETHTDLNDLDRPGRSCTQGENSTTIRRIGGGQTTLASENFSKP
jgi:hypothetical protein